MEITGAPDGTWCSSEIGDNAWGCGGAGGDYIPGLAPTYIATLPRDPLGGVNGIPACGTWKRAYLYLSDAKSYKILSHCAGETGFSASDPHFMIPCERIGGGWFAAEQMRQQPAIYGNIYFLMEEPLKLTPEQLHSRAEELYAQRAESKKEQEPTLSEEEKKIRQEIAEMVNTPPPAHIKNDVSEEVQKLLTLDDQAQIAELIKLVFTKDIIFALKVLRGMQNPAVVDAFHDLLAQDQLYYKLLKQKKL